MSWPSVSFTPTRPPTRAPPLTVPWKEHPAMVPWLIPARPPRVSASPEGDTRPVTRRFRTSPPGWTIPNSPAGQPPLINSPLMV